MNYGVISPCTSPPDAQCGTLPFGLLHLAELDFVFYIEYLRKPRLCL